MNISQYVTDNWSTLPKSTFDGDEVVVIKEVRNDDYGWGHHIYDGYGVNEDGELLWCYSSGCSCNGSCGTEHKFTQKTFEVDWPEDFTSINPETTDFSSMQVSFSTY